MPILAIKGEYEIELTHDCNWNCPYCAERYKMVDTISEDDALQKCHIVPYASHVTISGGEPGLMSRNLAERCIQILKEKQCHLYINTNGLFIITFPDLLHYFDEIIYHCSEDLHLDQPIIENIQHDNVRYMIIVNDDNLCRLQAFVDKYRDIKFDIIEATYNNVGDGPTLSRPNKHMVMTHFANRMTKESIQRMIHEKEFDDMFYL